MTNPTTQQGVTLREAAEKAIFEFEEILEWHRLEKSPLRQQELQSINTRIGQLKAALSQPPAPEQASGGCIAQEFGDTRYRAAVALLGAPTAEPVWEPEVGRKFVPLEPTPEMRKAAADAWLDCDSKLILNKAAAALKAGIAAARGK